MELTDRFQKTTIDRKVGFAQNKLLKNQLNEICKKIDRIEYSWDFDNNSEKQIELLALKKVKKSQLALWKRFRTKLGLSNELLKTV